MPSLSEQLPVPSELAVPSQSAPPPIKDTLPSRPAHNARPEEYGGLLTRFNNFARRIGLDTPPTLRIVESAGVGEGGHGTVESVSINSKILDMIEPDEADFLCAHELAHGGQQQKDQAFTDWQQSEMDADTVAVSVTGKPQAAISFLFRVAAVQKEEFLKRVPEPNPEATIIFEKGLDDYVRMRVDNIRKGPSR